jgi:hypothetical protein
LRFNAAGPGARRAPSSDMISNDRYVP